jgi:hypothetical protein
VLKGVCMGRPGRLTCILRRIVALLGRHCRRCQYLQHMWVVERPCVCHLPTHFAVVHWHKSAHLALLPQMHPILVKELHGLPTCLACHWHALAGPLAGPLSVHSLAVQPLPLSAQWLPPPCCCWLRPGRWLPQPQVLPPLHARQFHWPVQPCKCMWHVLCTRRGCAVALQGQETAQMATHPTCEFQCKGQMPLQSVCEPLNTG